MPATLDLNTLSEPLRAVFQCVVGESEKFRIERDFARVERETFRVEREEFRAKHDVSETERLRLTLENKLLKEAIRLLHLAKYGPKAEQLSDRQLVFQRQTQALSLGDIVLGSKFFSLNAKSFPLNAGEIPLTHDALELTRVSRRNWWRQE